MNISSMVMNDNAWLTAITNIRLLQSDKATRDAGHTVHSDFGIVSGYDSLSCKV